MYINPFYSWGTNFRGTNHEIKNSTNNNLWGRLNVTYLLTIDTIHELS